MHMKYQKMLTVDVVDLEEELNLVFRCLASKLVHCVQEFLTPMMIGNIIIIIIIIINITTAASPS